MFSLSRINLQCHGLLEGDISTIATIDVPAVGELDIILDRDSMGQIVLKETRMRPNTNWLAHSEMLLAAMGTLHKEAAAIASTAQLTFDELFKTKQMLEGK